MAGIPRPANPFVDDHSVLIWQTCAYAEELGDVARSGQRLTPALDALLEFLQYRLLPHLRVEERQLGGDPLLNQLLRTDHDRIRERVADLDASRTRRDLVRSCDGLVGGLDRHVQREERWVADRGRVLSPR